ncbi:hypothetical protein [Nocardiopsis tropica]|uniref:Uncharacterized protein n=1 Tax=Nocardiopsis tropica TaxID=109330 RepID=A0ABU7KPC3_9ACTN|nr:hypothetical protein [Nocardiopsis umidischolae]MEE2051124.1 hypothetical protein [Nocardiopsis umidischolae]
MRELAVGLLHHADHDNISRGHPAPTAPVRPLARPEITAAAALLLLRRPAPKT